MQSARQLGQALVCLFDILFIEEVLFGDKALIGHLLRCFIKGKQFRVLHPMVVLVPHHPISFKDVLVVEKGVLEFVQNTAEVSI